MHRKEKIDSKNRIQQAKQAGYWPVFCRIIRILSVYNPDYRQSNVLKFTITDSHEQ
jgi:hypothetical protein